MRSSYLTMVLMILMAMLPTTTARTAPHTADTASLSRARASLRLSPVSARLAREAARAWPPPSLASSVSGRSSEECSPGVRGHTLGGTFVQFPC